MKRFCYYVDVNKESTIMKYFANKNRLRGEMIIINRIYSTDFRNQFNILYRNAVHLLIQRLYDKYVWYGNSIEISFRERVVEVLIRLLILDKAILKINEKDTHLILHCFPEVQITNDDVKKNEPQVNPAKLILERQGQDAATLFLQCVIGGQNASHVRIEPKEPTFTIVIPFYSHLRYLESCLESVAEAVKHADNVRAEILLVNDDPRVSIHELEALIPYQLRRLTRIITNEENFGISRSLNREINEAQHNWIVHLDCDDMLTERTLTVLVQRIRRHPTARYISSRMLDIDDSRLLRCRLRQEGPCDLMSHGMVAGHLKAIRKDLFRDIGSYLNTYDGCQDYEFALRTSLFEPLLFIPDYLYKYRWHGSSQSVHNAKRQTETTYRIIQTYLLAGVLLTSSFEDLPLSLSFEGNHAEDWHREFRGRIAATSNKWRVRVIVRSPVEATRRKLFAIQMARHLVDCRNWPQGSETELTL